MGLEVVMHIKYYAEQENFLVRFHSLTVFIITLLQTIISQNLREND